jgi:signal transduction histidine kinase
MDAPRSKVLIVDDNQELSENLREILELNGYQAGVAASRQAGLLESKNGFDVALVDVVLPDGDGTELAALLKDEHPESEIVMLTGHAAIETASSAVRAGAFAYLLKPCSPDQLLLTLKQALRQVHLHAEKRELARRAQVNEKLAAVGTLTAGLSHEIRNPLNAAGLQLLVLERRVQKLDAELRPALLEPLQLVQQEVRRLDHILQDFLQFARPMKVDAKPASLGPVVTHVLDLLAKSAEEHGVSLQRELKETTALADVERIQQVVLNLCLNGIEAMTSGGTLSVGTRTEGHEAVITIDDTGPGIPDELRQRLFEPFFTTKATGSGLGLPIAHAIIEQHGGRIEARRRSEGGMRFEIRLPAPAVSLR